MFLRNSSHVASPNHARTRIAILDTGYDPEAAFLSRDVRRRLQSANWRDWVAQSKQPIDEDGHGTQIVSLLMKMAPLVDVVVARIARSSQDLASCDENIASVCALRVRHSVQRTYML